MKSKYINRANALCGDCWHWKPKHSKDKWKKIPREEVPGKAGMVRIGACLLGKFIVEREDFCSIPDGFLSRDAEEARREKAKKESKKLVKEARHED